MPATGAPPNTPVDTLKLTPLGSVPFALSVGVGVPVAVTVKLPAAPTVNIALVLLVIVGATEVVLTVRVKFCVAAVPTPLLAANVIG